MDRADHPRPFDRRASSAREHRPAHAGARRGARARRASAAVSRARCERHARRRSLRLPPSRRAFDGRPVRRLRPRLALPEPSFPADRCTPVRALGHGAGAGARDRRRERPPRDRGVHPRAPLHVPAGVPAQSDALRRVDDPHRARTRERAHRRRPAHRRNAARHRAHRARRAAHALRLPRSRRRRAHGRDARVGVGQGSRPRRLVQARARPPPVQDLRAVRRASAPRRSRAGARGRARHRALARPRSGSCTSRWTSQPIRRSAARPSRSWSCTRRARRDR